MESSALERFKFELIPRISITLVLALLIIFSILSSIDAQENTSTATSQAPSTDSGIYIEKYEIDVRTQNGSYIFSEVVDLINNSGKESSDGIEFKLPEGAQNIQPMSNLTQKDIEVSGQTLRIKIPFKTGTTNFSYSYIVQSDKVSFERTVPFEIRNMDIFVVDSISAQISPLQFEEAKTFENINYNIYGQHGPPIAKNTKVKIQLSPQSGGILGVGGFKLEKVLPYLIGFLFFGGVALLLITRRRRSDYYEDYEDDDFDQEYLDEDDYMDDEYDEELEDEDDDFDQEYIDEDDYMDDEYDEELEDEEDDSDDEYKDEEDYMEDEYEEEELEEADKDSVDDRFENEEDVYYELIDYLSELHDIGSIDRKIYERIRRNLSKLAED